MNNKIRYDKLNAKDLNAYKGVRIDCLRNHPASFGPTYEEETHKDELKFDPILRDHKKDDFVLGAFSIEQNELIGICGFMTEKRSKTKHRGDISQLYVQPAFQNMGIGKSLLEGTIEQAFSISRIEQITLGVVQNNIIAVQLYKKLGFIEYGRLENYFKSEAASYTQLMMALNQSHWNKMKNNEL